MSKPAKKKSDYPPYGAMLRIRVPAASVPTYMEMIDLRAELRRTLNVREVTVTTDSKTTIDIFTVAGDLIDRNRFPEPYEIVERFLETL